MLNNDHTRASHIEQNSMTINELEQNHADLNHEIEFLMEELNLTSHQVSACLADPKNFSEQEWKTIQEEKKKLEERLLQNLVSKANPLKTKKAYESRNIQAHWLYVR